MGYRVPFRPKTSAISIRLTHEKRPYIAGFPRSSAPWVESGAKPLFARPLAHFLRHLRHFSRSRALARSLLSFLASSKLHPNAGKKRQHSRSVKFTQAEWDTGFPFRPQNVSNQYPSNPRKPPNIAGFQGGSDPLVGFFARQNGALSSAAASFKSVTCASTLPPFTPCFLEITSILRQKNSINYE